MVNLPQLGLREFNNQTVGHPKQSVADCSGGGAGKGDDPFSDRPVAHWREETQYNVMGLSEGARSERLGSERARSERPGSARARSEMSFGHCYLSVSEDGVLGTLDAAEFVRGRGGSEGMTRNSRESATVHDENLKRESGDPV